MEKQITKRNKIVNHITFMLFFLAAVYLPLILILSARFSISDTSLSGIGYRLSEFPWLLTYGGLTVPFLIYEIGSYAKKAGFRRKDPVLIAQAACVLIFGGVFIPLDGYGDLVQRLHGIIPGIGAGIVLVTIAYFLFDYCTSHYVSRKKSFAAMLLYCLFIGVSIDAFFTRGTTAIFELSATFINMVVLFILNLLLARKMYYSCIAE